MKLYEEICSTLAKATTLDEKYIVLLLTSLVVIFIFRILKVLGKKVIQKITTGRREFVSNQAYQVTLNILEILVFIFLFDDYIKGLMTFISVISAAMTIALRDFILNFFCGIYIKFKKPFKVEDRIQIEDTKGDVMSISVFSFEILEVSTKEDNGQSTGIVIHYPNSIIVSKPVKNINLIGFIVNDVIPFNAKFKDEKVYAWFYGRTSWTSENEPKDWKYAKLAEQEESDE